MANPPGSLNLAALDERFVDALRDTSIASGARTRYMQDAYSRIWYKYPWPFTHNMSTFTATSTTDTYAMNAQVAEIAALLNQSQMRCIGMRRDIYRYFENYSDENHSGPLQNAIEQREIGGVNYIKFQETPSAGMIGDGDTISVYFCRHIIHNDSTGATATGNMTLPTDAPSWSPQFHAIIVKEALLEAIKDRRDFQEMYQLIKAERDEMLTDMRRHYFTQKKSGVLYLGNR